MSPERTRGDTLCLLGQSQVATGCSGGVARGRQGASPPPYFGTFAGNTPVRVGAGRERSSSLFCAQGGQFHSPHGGEEPHFTAEGQFPSQYAYPTPGQYAPQFSIPNPQHTFTPGAYPPSQGYPPPHGFQQQPAPAPAPAATPDASWDLMEACKSWTLEQWTEYADRPRAGYEYHQSKVGQLSTHNMTMFAQGITMFPRYGCPEELLQKCAWARVYPSMSRKTTSQDEPEEDSEPDDEEEAEEEEEGADGAEFPPASLEPGPQQKEPEQKPVQLPKMTLPGPDYDVEAYLLEEKETSERSHDALSRDKRKLLQ